MARNMYSQWTANEEKHLLASSTSGIPIKAIAQQHGRTPNAIKSRLQRIAYNYMSEGKSVAEAARLTGLPIKTIQRAGAPAPDSQNGKQVVSKLFLQMIGFTHTMSRSQLQAEPAKRRTDAIRMYIDNNIFHPVVNASAARKTSYLYVLPKTSQSMGSSYPPTYQVTPSDIIEGLTAKFPDCTVSFSDEWVDVRPGVREQRSGILVDWS